MLSNVQLFVTPQTVACQAPLSMGFPRQEYWSRLSFPSPGNLPDPGIEPTYLVYSSWQADSLPLHHLGICPVLIDNCIDRAVSNKEIQSMREDTLFSEITSQANIKHTEPFLLDVEL